MPTKENPSLLPVPIGVREVTAYFQRSLTPQQVNQLYKCSERYRRDYKLPLDYDHFTRSLPVLSSCIKEGLHQANGSSGFGESDNLENAFRAGYKNRQEIIEGVKKLTGKPVASGTFVGPLALPRQLFEGGVDELSRQYIFNPDLRQTRALYSEAAVREPIFDRLLNFAIIKARKLEPISKPPDYLVN